MKPRFRPPALAVLALATGLAGCDAGQTRDGAAADPAAAPADSPALRPPAYNPDEPHPPAGVGPELRLDTAGRPAGEARQP